MTAKPAKSTTRAAKAAALPDPPATDAETVAPSNAEEPPAQSAATGSEPAEPGPAAQGGDAQGADDEGEGEVFLNRAQRRAKGRNPAQAQLTGRGKVTSGHGPAGTQRNWANRRSG